jgi:hypothetical protein
VFSQWLTQSYQDRIMFDKPNMLEDTIQKDKCFYDHSKHKQEALKIRRGRTRLDSKRRDSSPFHTRIQGRCIVWLTK